MSRKAIKLTIIYTSAVILCLVLLSAVLYSRLADYRRAALYSSREAFEETVTAVDGLSKALRKSVYATDGGMCAKICAEANANAMAAQAAIATLPFETVQLEQTSAFLNTVGDYTWTMAREAAQGGFSQERVDELAGLAQTAGDFARMLTDLRRSLNDGETVMDSMETPLANVGPEAGEKLSASLLEFEAAFSPMTLSYDGQYGYEKEKSTGSLSEEEKLSIASRAVGKPERELQKQYDYEAENGLSCYAAGDKIIIVSSKGLESMASSRLIDAGSVSEEQAKQNAEKFLRDMGFEGLTFAGAGQSGGVYELRYCPGSDDAVWVDNYLRVCIASDDGSVHSFDASRICEAQEMPEWSITREQAQEKLPQSLTTQSDRKVIVRSDGNRAVPTYEFTCKNEAGEGVIVYVDGKTGEQYAIDFMDY